MSAHEPTGAARMSKTRSPRRRWYTTAAVAAAALILAACGSSGTSHKGGTATVKSGGSLTFALDEDVAGFNILQASEAEFVLQEIMDQVWPQVFITQPNLKPKLNTAIVTSAKLTKSNPQTVVYQINPKAKWSDGVPISAADFIYNWQAQSGDPKFKDVGGKAFLPASTAGFSSIKSVTGSNGGKTVTVVFAKPFGDWQSLYGPAGPMIPAHIAKKSGFNSGFATFGPAVKVSGGPYEIQSYTKGEDLVEVPNPNYWGPKAHLSKLIFRFILNDDQQPPAVQNGEANMVNPVIPSISFYRTVKAIPGFTTMVEPGLEFQHMDFNQANPYLAKASIRHAIAYGTNRQQMITRIVDPLNPKPSIAPLQNRIWLATQPEYQDTSGGAGAYNPAKAKALLKGSGMTMGSDGYFHPNFGPEKGKDFSVTISTTSGVPVRAAIEELLQAQMKNIGVKLNIHNYDANTLFGTVGPKSEFDIIEFAWVQAPFASGNQPIYCSFTNTANCGENWDHYADPQVDTLFNQAVSTLDPAAAAKLYNQIDSVLWKDMATLPLFQNPDLYGWTSKYGNVIPNTSNIGIPWNANQWGLKA
jgi:peptide/nickel transport system substrate-binding protein